MSDELDFIFHGESAKECNDFIRAARKHARVNKKTRDNDWIAGEVYDAFSGKALRWYLDQTPEVQGDWSLLQKALLDRWVGDDESDDRDRRRHSGVNRPSAPPLAAGSAPTPAPATSGRITSGLSGKIGRLRIRSGLLHTNDEFLSKTMYDSGERAWKRGSFLATSDPDSAMHVKLLPATNGLWQLEMVAHPSGRKFLAGYFVGPFTSRYGFLVGVDVPTGTRLQEHGSTYFGDDGKYEFRVAVWKLQDERYLSLVWSENENDAEKRHVPIVRKGAAEILLSEPHKSDGEEKQVEFEFEVLKDQSYLT